MKLITNQKTLNCKYRNELKYFITKYDMIILQNKLRSIMKIDSNVSAKGYYSIKSLYYDDFNDTSFYQVLNGLSKREKYRIRFYDNDANYISIEKKSKINNMTNKRNEKISQEQFWNILNKKDLVISEKNSDLLNEFYEKILFFGYNPKCIIQYDRIPYVYKSGGVRITFDYNISASYDITTPFVDNNRIPVLEDSFGILEVKYNEFIPEFLRDLLQLKKLNLTSYSKYLNSRLVLKKLI